MTEDNNGKHLGVILMRGAIFDFYIPSYSATVFSFKLPVEAYAEMEIKNLDLAVRQIVDFFAVNKVPPTEFFLIMQTPLFRKEFPIAPQEKLESSINLYLDYIPFDSVISKRIKTDVGVMVIAANGDLIQTIGKMLMEVSSSLICTTALDGLTIFPKGGLSVLTQLSAQTILKNAPLIKQESFSLTPLRSVEGFEVVEEEEEKKEKSTLPFLIPVFLILLGILGYVYFKTSAPPTPAPRKVIQPTLIPAIPKKSATSIKITTEKSASGKSIQTKEALLSAGYSTLTEEQIADSAASRSFVIYSSTLPLETKDAIQSILIKSIPNIVVEPARESSFDVMIVVGK